MNKKEAFDFLDKKYKELTNKTDVNKKQKMLRECTDKKFFWMCAEKASLTIKSLLI
jgi:hypothetical protein